MLITFLVFALLSLLLLLALLWYFIPSSRVATSIPGLRPADQVWGNLPNIADAGGLPQFLQNLHSDYGSLASFWLGDFLAISVGSHNLFKLVDKSCSKKGLIYQTIVPLTLDKDILEQTSPANSFLNSLLSNFSPFTHQAGTNLGSEIKALTEELCGVLGNFGKEDQVAIDDYIDALAVKIVADTSGLVRKPDMPKLRLAYTKLMLELESVMEAGKEASEDKRKFLIKMAEEFLNIVDRSSGSRVFGLITVVSVMSTWVLYYLARYPKLQTSVRQNNSLLVPFLEEVVRVTGFLPITARVIDKQELSLLGHTIEEGTVVINSLSVISWDQNVFPNPKAVDLNRDNTPNILNMINPSYNKSYSYCAITSIVETVLGNFKIELATPEIEIGQKFTFVMKPDTDIWIKLQKL